MKVLLAATLAVILFTAACGGSSASTTTTPTTTPPSVTETFTGTVPVGGNDVKPFTVGQAGEVDITLTQAGDPPTITMGLGVGAPAAANSSTCILFSGGFLNTQAGSNAQLVGTLPTGSYCVEVYDIGNQAAPVTYTVTVAHP